MSLSRRDIAGAAVGKLASCDQAILEKLRITIPRIDVGEVELQMSVAPDMVNSQNVCHGGFLFTLADTASAYVTASMNLTPITTEAGISYISPARLADTVTAVARMEGSSDKAFYSTVNLRCPDGRLVAIYRSTVITRGIICEIGPQKAPQI